MEELPSPSTLAKNRRTAVGRAGEDVAADRLRQLGYNVTERNWRCRAGELDLIALDGETLVFVEVRSRTNPTRFGSAVEAVTPRKCRQVRELAAVYIKQRKAEARSVRFDVAAVTFNGDGSVREFIHLQGAF
jgi:putative endonuclease